MLSEVGKMPRVTTNGLKESLELINISVLIYHMQIMQNGVITACLMVLTNYGW